MARDRGQGRSAAHPGCQGPGPPPALAWVSPCYSLPPPPDLSLPVRLPFASSRLSAPSTCPRVPPWEPSCPCHVLPFMHTPLLSFLLAGPYLAGAPGGRGPSARLHPADWSPGGSGRCALALSKQMPLRVSPSARSGSGRTGRQEGKAAQHKQSLLSPWTWQPQAWLWAAPTHPGHTLSNGHRRAKTGPPKYRGVWGHPRSSWAPPAGEAA